MGRTFLISGPILPIQLPRCEEPSREDTDLFKIAPTDFSIDYETMHHRFSHPSPDVLKKAQEHTLKFPSKVEFPMEIPICRGCAEEKMHSRSFLPTDRQASWAFELIHFDLKSFLIDSYHWYKYYILFLDNFTRMAWITCLCLKSAAITATRQFLAAVKAQYNSSVQK